VKDYENERFEVLTTMLMKISVFWDMMPFRFYEFIDFSEEIAAPIFGTIQRRVMKTVLYLAVLILRKVSIIVNFTPTS
jgi:hypothetical protein